MPQETLIQPIPTHKQAARGWSVIVDGTLLERVASVIIDHPRFGTLAYGETPMGHDGWAFHEIGGGGNVTVPFVVINGALHIGVVRQLRPNQGGEVWNAPRGFLEPNEVRHLGATREFQEEVGLATPPTLVNLPGALTNPNSTFFETWGHEEGVAFYAVAVDAGYLEQGESGWRFRADVLDGSEATSRSRALELISRAQFFPWIEVAGFGDLFTVAAVARLTAYLHSLGTNIR